MPLQLENHNTLGTLNDATLDQIIINGLMSHLTDTFTTLQDCYRVLQPGGILDIQDGLNSNHKRTAQYIDTIYRMFTPSHKHFAADYEWRGVLLDAGFEIITFQTKKKIQIVPETPHREKIRILLQQAPERVSQFLSPIDANQLTFTYREVQISVKKPE